jgi:hypothetical protein
MSRPDYLFRKPQTSTSVYNDNHSAKENCKHVAFNFVFNNKCLGSADVLYKKKLRHCKLNLQLHGNEFPSTATADNKRYDNSST